MKLFTDKEEIDGNKKKRDGERGASFEGYTASKTLSLSPSVFIEAQCAHTEHKGLSTFTQFFENRKYICFTSIILCLV